MTTPERLRRRQRVESSLVVLVIILTCVSTWVTLDRAGDTQDCLEDTVQELTEALQVRSTNSIKSQELITDRVDLLSELLSDIATLVLDPSPNEAEQSQAFRDLLSTYQIDLAELDKQEETIDKVRKENPYPDYPDGKCD